MLEYLSVLDWDTFNSTSDPNTQWLFIYNALIAYLDITCPVREFNIKKTSEPWVSPDTIELINDRQDMLREVRITNNKALLEQVRKIKNRIHRQLENGQGEYVFLMLERAEGDPVKFWCEINALVNPVTKNLTIQLVNGITGEVILIDKTADFINDSSLTLS